jgi:predicted dehydrogenase
MAGLGFWGQTWVKIISDHPDAELVAVVDPSEAAAVWAVENLDIPLFSSFSEAQRQIKFDAVLIATPPNRHASVAIEALGQGFHVLLEKPIASTREDAMAIESAAANSTGYAMIAQGYRFLDGPRKIRELLQSGTIGSLTSIRIHFRQCLPALFETRPDHLLFALNHSILIDMSVHHIDLVRYITQQEIGKTYAFEYQTPENVLQYPSNAVCVFSLTDGTEVLWDGDWCVFENLTCWEGEWELIGKEARLFWRGDLEGKNYRSSLWIQTPGKPKIPINFTESVVDRRTPLLGHFIDAIEKGEQPQPSVSDNIRTFRTVLGCIDSIERKSEVRF